jgi:hypothetical protein
VRPRVFSNPELVPPRGWRDGRPYVRLGRAYGDRQACFHYFVVGLMKITKN